MRKLRSLAIAAALSGVGVSLGTGNQMMISRYDDELMHMEPVCIKRKKYKSRCRKRMAKGWS